MRESFDKAEKGRSHNTLQRTAAHCNALQHTAAHCSTRSLSVRQKSIDRAEKASQYLYRCESRRALSGKWHVSVAVCCSVLQCVALCCRVLQSAAVCCSVLQCTDILHIAVSLNDPSTDWWHLSIVFFCSKLQ